MATMGDGVWWKSWLVLVSEFSFISLELAVWSHVIVSLIRFCGFNAKRNVYKPFLSTTVIDFFNRYYYYFKELLVDFFFYPTFFRLKNKVGVNYALFAAIVMAAGVGNFLFHYFREMHFIVKLGIWQAIVNLHVFMFYCFLLSVGIFVSQHRRQVKRLSQQGLFDIYFQRLSVILFYTLIFVFRDLSGQTNIIDHMSFFLSLFGIEFLSSV